MKTSSAGTRKCLSYEQRMKLVSVAKFAAGRGSPDSRYECRITTTRALRNRGLIDFDGKRYVVTDAGRGALIAHGYEADGTWRGSNQPRTCR